MHAREEDKWLNIENWNENEVFLSGFERVDFKHCSDQTFGVIIVCVFGICLYDNFNNIFGFNGSLWWMEGQEFKMTDVLS